MTDLTAAQTHEALMCERAAMLTWAVLAFANPESYTRGFGGSRQEKIALLILHSMAERGVFNGKPEGRLSHCKIAAREIFGLDDASVNYFYLAHPDTPQKA